MVDKVLTEASHTLDGRWTSGGIVPFCKEENYQCLPLALTLGLPLSANEIELHYGATGVC